MSDNPPAAPPAGQPRLLDRVRIAVRSRHYSLRTEESYVAWVRRFILFHGKRHPLEMAEQEINAFLSHLAVRAHVSASTQTQALSALLFLYRHVLEKPLPAIENIVRAKRPVRLPTVMTKAEVREVLLHLNGTPRLIATLLYGTGMRLMECLRLRVKDLDFESLQITVRDGKGSKDRLAILPLSAREHLRAHLSKTRAIHQADLASGDGRVFLPQALARKYPNAEKEWAWQWVFPAPSLGRDPRTGVTRRHHLHEVAWPSP